MAVDAILELEADTWTEITNDDATSLTAIHRTGAEVLIRPTVGQNAPAAGFRGGVPISRGSDQHPSGHLKKALADLTFQADPTRAYALAIGGSATIFVETD